MGAPVGRRSFLKGFAIVEGMLTKRALAWGEDQVRLAIQGKLETKGKA